MAFVLIHYGAVKQHFLVGGAAGLGCALRVGESGLAESAVLLVVRKGRRAIAIPAERTVLRLAVEQHACLRREKF